MNYHIVKQCDRARILCNGCYNTCRKPADVCVHVHWDTGNTTGVSFFYYCTACQASEFHGEVFELWPSKS